MVRCGVCRGELGWESGRGGSGRLGSCKESGEGDSWGDPPFETTLRRHRLEFALSLPPSRLLRIRLSSRLLNDGKHPFPSYVFYLSSTWKLLLVKLCTMVSGRLCQRAALAFGLLPASLGEGRKGVGDRDCRCVCSRFCYRHGELTREFSVALAYVMHKTPNVFPITGGRKTEHLLANIEVRSFSLPPRFH